MSTAIPIEIRDRLRQKIWSRADELNWSKITVLERAAWYENWSKDKEIGGVLAHFMDPRKVRVYIKDSLLKAYLRSGLQDEWSRVLLSLEIEKEAENHKKAYEKPLGRLLLDGKVVCWGNSRDWKLVLISVFERAYSTSAASPYAAVLMETGKTTDIGAREMIIEAGKRLGVSKVIWLDD